MPKTIKVATSQMDATPAPLSERLERTEKIVTQAAQAGAQLIVLPELFNSGYAYTDDNFKVAESLNGITGTWMKTISARLGVHLAGTFILLEHGEIYDTLLLFSPSGQMWRYDKSYPWAWERAYFRGRRGITVANTELGVPAVNSGASGQVQTHVPKASALLRSFSLFAPHILKLLPKAEQLQMSCSMIPSCKVVDAGGNILVERAPSEGEGFILSDVTLTDSKSMPAHSQPDHPLSRMKSLLALFNADILIPAMMRSVYKNGLRKLKQ